MPYYYGFDFTYLILIVPTILLALWAQMRVQSAFNTYSKVYASRGYTAAEVAPQDSGTPTACKISAWSGWRASLPTTTTPRPV